MTDVFLSIALLLLALGLGSWRVTQVRGRAMAGMLLVGWHTLWCLVYWQYSMITSADATVYLAHGAFGEATFIPGTKFVISLCVVLVRVLGLSVLNAFLVFNLAGVLGLLLLRRALWEATEGLPSRALHLTRLMVWLPGLSFWSAAPGKDGIAFMGATMAVFGSLDLGARWPWLLLGVGAMFTVRPHMAAILVVAGALAYLLGRRREGRGGLALWLGLILASMVVVPYALEYVGLGSLDEVEDVTSYVEKRQSTNLGGNSSVDISTMSPPERLFTFMFRPLFVDATSVTGLVASTESLLLLLFVATAGLSLWRSRPRPSGFTFRFNLLCALASWLVLANVIANLGIAVRQKTMIVPSLLMAGALALTRHAQVRRRSRAARGAAAVSAGDYPADLAATAPRS